MTALVHTQPPVVLTIAGSDSGGGAGIQADLKTCTVLGAYGASVITALTAQNTRGVTAVHAVPPEFVAAQLDAVLSDLDVRAVKTGMLGDPGILAVVAKYAADGRLPKLVVDPVLVATSGDRLYDGDAADYLGLLAPHATVLTPNLPEAEVLLGGPVRDAAAAAAELATAGTTAVVLKGGHREGPDAVDVVWHQGRTYELSAPFVDTRNTHGTGCTFSAAIAARLALGDGLDEALRAAKAYVSGAIAAARDWSLGRGKGPVDHLYQPHREGDST